MIRFLVGLILSLGALIGAYMLEGGMPYSLVGISAFLITFFMPFFGALAVWKFAEWKRAWRHAFGAGADAAAVKVSVELWKFNEFACYLSGLIGFLIGLVLILGNIAEAPVERIAHAFGAGLVAPIYGLVFGFVCRILRARVEAPHP